MCMYVYINFFGFAMAFAESWFHHHHRSLRQRDGLGTLGHHVVRPTPPVACRRHGHNAALQSRLASLAFDSPSPRGFFSLYHTETKKKFISIKTTKKIVVN